MTLHRWDVLGLGCVAVDDLLYLPAFPEPDRKMRLRRRERQCGGLTATALVAAARQGARAAFAGVLGEDESSLFVREALTREGVDLGPAILRPDARPIHSTILVDESCHTRTILYDLAGATGADPALPPEDVLRQTRVLLVDHFGIEGMTRAARLAQQAGVAVVADFERDEWPGFAELLALVDHLIVSSAFAARRTGEADPRQAVEALWAPGREVVVVTCGAEGGWYRGSDGPARPYPAFPVATVDTTGCGDVFHGAYAAALARGEDLESRLRYAAAAAAIKATHPGAQAGIPTLAATREFLRGCPGTSNL